MTASALGGPDLRPDGLRFALDHVGVVVPDLDEATAFFTDVLGFRPVRTATIGGPADRLAATFGATDGATLRVAFLATDGGTVELLEWTAPEARADVRAPQDLGTAHLALSVPDVEAAAARLAAAPGVTVFEPSPRGFVYARAPWGLLLQLVLRRP